MKKRILATFVATSLVTISSLIGTPSANAVSCNAFNQGTTNAYHGNGGINSKNAPANGIYKLAIACHS